MTHRRNYTKEQIDKMRDNGAFEEYCDFHDPGTDPEVVYETIATGMLHVEDLPDFRWQDYL